jgi:DNA-binding NtrC family response regulator
MRGAVILDREETRVLNVPDAVAPQPDARLGNRIEMLKELALTLLKEVETLDQSHATQVRRGISFYDEVRRFESNLIRRALMRTGGNQTRAARLLGIKVTTLNTKIKRYKISTDVYTDDTAVYDRRESIFDPL